MMKDSVLLEDQITPYLHVFNNTASKYIKQKLIEINEKIIMRVLTFWMWRQKSIQNIKDFDSRISSFVLYVGHPIAEECPFFQVHKEYFKISHSQDTKLISNLNDWNHSVHVL